MSDLPPIPSYEEATSSRTVSDSRRGRGEVSDDAERQGLLPRGNGDGRDDNYRPPTVESPRSSEDSQDIRLPELLPDDHDTSSAGDAADLRRDMEQMDIIEPSQPRRFRRHAFSKPFAQLSHTLSNLQVPSSIRRMRFPSISLSLPSNYRNHVPVIARLFGLVVVATLVYALFAFDVFSGPGGPSQRYDPESVRVRVQSDVDPQRIADYLRYMTSFDHVAGTEGDLYLAKWIEEMWQAAELDQVETESFFVHSTYPKPDGRRVAIVEPAELKWEAQLEEGNVYGTREKQQTLVWHADSKSADVTGPLVYGNRGAPADFAKLKELGVSVNGSVLLLRNYRDVAWQVKAAEDAGAIGCIIYSDPADDGAARGKTVPEGPWRPLDSVQRDRVSRPDWVLGDVLTPGHDSSESADRVTEEGNPGLPSIPSIPLSARDAQHLLQSLAKHGKSVPSDWVGAVPDVSEWFTGDVVSSPRVNLRNVNDENPKQLVWNVHATIRGMETESRRLIVGTHRDAWCFGGVDPGSASAVLMEVVGTFSRLRTLGWRPLRTIEFVSWDGGVTNLVGSTEHVEANLLRVRDDGIAYLDMAPGVGAAQFAAYGNPLLARPLRRTLDRVATPAGNESIAAQAARGPAPLVRSATQCPSGPGDDVPFQSIAGLPSLRIGYTGDIDDSGTGNGGTTPWLRGSCYDTYEWIERFADPVFSAHAAMVQVWALMILEVADAPLLPFDLREYAAAVSGFVDDLARVAEQAEKSKQTEGEKGTKDSGRKERADDKLDLTPLRNAATSLAAAAESFHAFEDEWSSHVLRGSGAGFESPEWTARRLRFNVRLAGYDAGLLDGRRDGPRPHVRGGADDGTEESVRRDEGGDKAGIPGREQYKHVIYGPRLDVLGADDGHGGSEFPAVRIALAEGDWVAAQKAVLTAATRLDAATHELLKE